MSRLKRKTKTRLTIAAFLFVVLAVFAAVIYFTFIYEKPEKGEVQDVKIEDAVVTVDTMSNGEKPEAQFNKHECKLDYEFAMLKNGRGMIKIPYPKTWKVSKYSDYDIIFQAPEDDKYFPGHRIFFHSTLEPQDIESSHDVIKQFDTKIASDKFTIDGAKYQLSPASSLDERVIDTDISDPNLQLYISYKDTDCLTTDYRHNGLYHQTTAFYWYGMPMILTGMTINANAANLDDLLLTMMSNSEYERDTLGDTVPIKAGDLSFDISPLYTKAEIEGDGWPISGGTVFYCPPDTGTGFSHSSIGVYTISKKEWEDISNYGEDFESEIMPTIIKDTFGDSANTAYVLGYMDKDMDSTVNFGEKQTKEYVYRFTFSRTNGMVGCFPDQDWIIATYPIKHKNHVDIITLVTTQGGLPCSMEVIEKIAETIKY